MGRVKGGERERGKGKEGGRQRAEGEGGGESGKQPQVTGDFSVTLAHSTVPPTPLHAPLPSRITAERQEVVVPRTVPTPRRHQPTCLRNLGTWLPCLPPSQGLVARATGVLLGRPSSGP